MTTKTNSITKINNWLVALFLCSTCMAVVLPSEGIVVLTNIIMFGALLVLNAKNYFKNGSCKYSIIVAGVLIVLFLINMLFASEKQLTDFFLHFVCFGLPVLFFPLQNVDYGKVVRNVAILAILFLPFFLTHDYGFSAEGGDEGSDDGELMTASYRVLPLICGLLLALFDNERKKYKIVHIFFCISYMAFLLVIGSRGAILAVLVFFVFLFISKAKKESGRLMRVGIITAVLGIVMSQFENIIEWLYLQVEKAGLNLLPLSRLYFKVTNDSNMDSGRGDLYAKAMQDFNDSPLWGKGIASFENYSGYPHNLFVQMLQEGGVLLFIPFAIVFLLGLRELILGDQKTTYYRVLLLTFCGGVMQLMFSSYYWTSSLFWFFIFLILYRKTIQNKIN